MINYIASMASAITSGFITKNAITDTIVATEVATEVATTHENATVVAITETAITAPAVATRILTDHTGFSYEATIFNIMQWGDPTANIRSFYSDIQFGSPEFNTIKIFIWNFNTFEQRITLYANWLNGKFIEIFRKFDYRREDIAQFITDMYYILDKKKYPLLSYEENEFGLRKYDIKIVPINSRHIGNIFDDIEYVISTIDIAFINNFLN
jgi:hypothetical protein